MYVYNVIYCARGSHGVQSSCWLAALFCTVQLLNLHFGDVSRGRARYDLSRWSVRWLLLYSWDAPALCWWLIGQWRTVAVVTVGVVRVMLLWFNQSVDGAFDWHSVRHRCRTSFGNNYWLSALPSACRAWNSPVPCIHLQRRLQAGHLRCCVPGVHRVRVVNSIACVGTKWRGTRL